MLDLCNVIGCKLSDLFIKSSDCALYDGDLPVLETRLAALSTDPGRHCIERQVVAVPANVSGRRRAYHCPSTVDAMHDAFLARKR